ncbi:prenyltransferase/squalene oxidase repeat-containing protein [Anatilimnocola aggregata]|uniref:prenyltransferase/squalene oxidase repeat-containing protein n=1 Tax=Anatilimnocola aggregata TaxID=2528021 RepID=UPI00119DD5C6|nr:prenyltransferase/squalene oxidase repeat-containing protein [Anatilimnocola aggregata]
MSVHITIEPETRRQWLYRCLFGRRSQQVVFCGLMTLYGHLIAIVVLSIYMRPVQPRQQQFPAATVIAQWTPEEQEPLPPTELHFTPPEIPEGLPTEADAVPVPTLAPDAPNVPAPTAGQASAPLLLDEGKGVQPSPQMLLTNTELKIGGGYEGRTTDARDRLAAARGGSPASERAVELGLNWLAAHQHKNGGWQFDHQHGKCAGKCSHPGTHQSTTAATSLALLAFMGAGQTHREGNYQLVVERGLDYLVSRVVPNSRGGDFQEGTMYAQGLAALALCEAYAITQDNQLHYPAQLALDYIINVQHPLGGWRYFPGQTGDTTVLGSQLLALHSGQLAGLQIPTKSFVLAHEFLDRVQDEGGATYGYQSPGDQPTPSAIGLLCRMHRSWKRTDPRLIAGLEKLAARGPDEQDLYFNYYATQALHHFDGPLWEKWNLAQRDRLIATQVQEGHAAGSWYTPDHHTVAGGRLCDTALAVMILEVYYRHMPLYGHRGAGDF